MGYRLRVTGDRLFRISYLALLERSASPYAYLALLERSALPYKFKISDSKGFGGWGGGIPPETEHRCAYSPEQRRALNDYTNIRGWKPRTQDTNHTRS